MSSASNNADRQRLNYRRPMKHFRVKCRCEKPARAGEHIPWEFAPLPSTQSDT
jgi:hypothetical protein